MLSALEQDVVHLIDEYPANTKDPVWIPEVCAKGYVIITSDKEMNRVRAEAEALRKYGAIAFFLPHTAANVTIFELARFICKCWPNVTAAAAKAKPGDMFDVQYRNGKVEARKSKK